MKGLKRYIIILFMIVIMPLTPLFVGCSSGEHPPDDFSIYEFELNSDNSGYKLVYFSGTIADVNIPNEYNGKPVVEIADFVFFNSNIISLKIPDTIKIIGKQAISGCGRLRSLEIGSGITEIKGTAPFSNLFLLKEVTVKSKCVYKKAAIIDESCLTFAQTIKVPKSVADNATNEYLNDTTKYTKTVDGDYYIYTKIK